MAVTVPWQVEIRSTILGTGTSWITDRSGGRHPGGFGIPDTKADGDVDPDGQHGTYGGPDYMGPRIISWPFSCTNANYPALRTLWLPIEDGAELTASFYLPWGIETYVGRPRGLVDDLSESFFGRMHAVARFDALYPIAS